MTKRSLRRVAPWAVLLLAASVFALPGVSFAAAPTGSSAVLQNTTTSSVDMVVTGANFIGFVSASSTTANATDTANITYRGIHPSAAVINSSTTLTLTFPISMGTDKSGSLTFATSTLKDASSTPNAFITIANGSITDSAKPIIRTVTIYDTDADGKIDKLVYVWSEPIDTDDSAAPVAGDMPTTLLPDGSTATFGSATISDPTGTTSTVTVTGVTGQATADTAADATAISGDLSTKWVDAATNAAHATISTGGETIVDAAAPAVISSTPASGSLQNLAVEPSITFSEPMDTASIAFSSSPAVTYTPAWSNSNKTVTFAHAKFSHGTLDASLTAGNAAAGTAVTTQNLPYAISFTVSGSSGGGSSSGGGGGSSSGSGSSSNSNNSSDDSATIANLMAQLAVLQAQLAAIQGPAAVSFTMDLTVGSTGAEVRALQVYLNGHGFAIAASGAGSAGNETMTFGGLTKAALAKFQKSVGISPASGFFGPKTRAYVNAHL